jgi:hypothetical protein
MMKVYVRNSLNQPVGLIAFDFSKGDDHGRKALILSMSYSRCSQEDKFDKNVASFVATKRMQNSPFKMYIRHGLTEGEMALIFDEMAIPYDTNFRNAIPDIVRIINTEMVCYMLYLLGCNDTKSAAARFEPKKEEPKKSAPAKAAPTTAKTQENKNKKEEVDTLADILKEIFNNSTEGGFKTGTIVVNGPISKEDIMRAMGQITWEDTDKNVKVKKPAATKKEKK